MRVAAELRRWMLASVFGVALHACLAGALFTRDAESDPAGPSGAFVVELAPVPVASAHTPVIATPMPDQVEAPAAAAAKPAPDPDPVLTPAQSQIPPMPDLPPLPTLPVADADAVLPPETKPEDSQHAAPAAPPPAPTTSVAQAPAEQVAERAAAPHVAPPSKSTSDTLPSWQTKLATVLERSKRYPARAQARQQEGVVQVYFEIDRDGRLLSSRIVKSSGHEILDAEALALLERAQPFPVPPRELKGIRVALAVPIRFFLH